MTRTMPEITPLPPDLRIAFETLVKDAIGEFGPTPLAHLVASHMALFADLRRRRASWAQIAGLLAAHGIGGAAGFTADVLRATYARAIKTAHAADRERNGRNATQHSVTERNATLRAEPRRDEAKRDYAKPNGATDDSILRRASLIDRPWHTR